MHWISHVCTTLSYRQQRYLTGASLPLEEAGTLNPKPFKLYELAAWLQVALHGYDGACWRKQAAICAVILWHGAAWCSTRASAS